MRFIVIVAVLDAKSSCATGEQEPEEGEEEGEGSPADGSADDGRKGHLGHVCLRVRVRVLQCVLCAAQSMPSLSGVGSGLASRSDSHSEPITAGQDNRLNYVISRYTILHSALPSPP